MLAMLLSISNGPNIDSRVWLDILKKNPSRRKTYQALSNTGLMGPASQPKTSSSGFAKPKNFIGDF